MKQYIIELFLTGSRAEQWLENTACRKLDTCVVLSACDSSFQIFSVLTFSKLPVCIDGRSEGGTLCPVHGDSHRAAETGRFR